MQLLRNKKLNAFIKVICLACIIAMMGISFCIYNTSITNSLLFLFFIVFFVQLPGNAIISFFKIDTQTQNLSEKILLGLFTGWSLVVLEYFICDLLHTNIIYFLNPILVIAFLFLKYKRYKEDLRNVVASGKSNKIFSLFNRIPTALYICVVITLLYVILITQYNYISPGTGAAIFPTIDKAFQMGIVNSLVNDFPAVNPWVDGMTIHYHIFSQILYAVSIKIFPSLTSDFIIMSCGPYLLTFTFCLSFFALFKRFCKRDEFAGIYTLLVMLSNPFIARTPVKSYIFRIVLVNDNYAGYGVAAVISWIILFDIYNKSAHPRKAPIVILLVANFMLLTGIKAPMGLVMLGALVGTLILALIMGELKLSDVGVTLASGLGFAVIYKILLVSNSEMSSASASIFSFGKITKLCFWKHPLVDFLTGLHITGVAKLAIILLVFFITFFSVFFFPMCVGYIREFVLVVSRKKNFDFSKILIYAAVLVGTVLMMITHYTGRSQVYFGIVAFAFSPLVAFWFFEDVSSNSAKWMQILKKICICLSSLILIFSVITLSINICNNAKLAIEKANPEKTYFAYRSMNPDEQDAMEWIKNNTPEDSLLATQMYASAPRDKYLVDNRYLNCHFLYAVYSNRNFYLEGSGFSIESGNVSLRKRMIAANNKLYEVGNEDRGEWADKLGIDYVVVTKFVDGPLKLDNKDYKKCYSNDTIDIYEIK